MARIKFDIKYRPQIESGEYKLEIGKSDPWPARIVCWDLNGNDLIVLVTNPEGKEEGLIYTPEGKHKAYAPRIDSDLFIVTPEEELSEFEIHLLDWLSSDTSGEIPMERMKDVVRNRAAELLAIARKELEPEVLERLEEAYKNQDEVVYEHGKRDGKAEALKDLPRWKPAAVCYDGDRLPRIDRLLKRFVAKFEEGIFYLDINDLYKLPGFKALEEE